MAFDLSNYEPVEDRLAKFWADYPKGRVVTTLLEHGDGDWVFSAALYREVADLDPFAVGHAHEHVTQKGVNATSACENCETSAIGRALANAGYAPKGARPSREEMQKVQGPPPASKGRVDALVGRVRAEDLTDWVKAQGLIWPWSDAACDAIEAKLAEVSTQPELEPVPDGTVSTPDLAKFEGEEPF